MSLGSVNLTNLYSLGSLNAYGRTSAALQSSIEKLSTGLGINHASDNPSGLSISEKMRTYINGLKEASLNTQDGISYLQTAEGATEEIISMLQRMRELSVQSANGTYTSNDRMEIQKEMDQLKDEINRISQSAEFNTKKLINGESSGVWNSSSSKIGAVITGAVEEGNYDIRVDVEAGKNQIQQTHILSIKEGAFGAELKNAGNTNINAVRDPQSLEASSANGGDYTLSVRNPFLAAGDTAKQAGSFLQEGSLFIPGAIQNVNANESGYVLIEFDESSENAGQIGTSYRAKFMSAETGSEGGWMDAAINTNGTLSLSYNSNGFNISFDMPISSGNDSRVTAGDKLLIAVTDTKGQTVGDDLLSSGGGTLTLTMGGVEGPTVTYLGVNSLTPADNDDGKVDVNHISLYTMAIDSETGYVAKGSVIFDFAENQVNTHGHGVTKAGTMSFEVRGAGEAATSTTKLSDIANFIDDDGNEILQNTQELRIYGNSSYASVFLEAGDTVEELSDKLTKAIVKDLDMGSDSAAINKKLVKYISSEGGAGINAVRGTMLIQSALTGDSSSLSFIGNQRVIDALGLAEVQKSENNISKVTVSNHHTGVLMGEVVTSGERVKDVVEGVSITIDTRAGAEAKWNPATDLIEFQPSNRVADYSMNLHIVSTGTKIQIGTEKGENVDVSLPQLDTEALGISGTVISSQEAAQRAIADMDSAITYVNTVRSQIGAKINRLESTASYLQNAATNMTASESRIRDTDVASVTTAYTTAQVMAQAQLAVLAQANQLPQSVVSLLQA